MTSVQDRETACKHKVIRHVMQMFGNSVKHFLFSQQQQKVIYIALVYRYHKHVLYLVYYRLHIWLVDKIGNSMDDVTGSMMWA